MLLEAPLGVLMLYALALALALALSPAQWI
jgi:hypothetical protein